jgi:spermidine synthase
MSQPRNRAVFLFFFLSGFCGLLYQVVWVRLAYASFGIITPVLSVVISVFMAGLSLGSWAGGRWVGPLRRSLGISPLFLYAVAELLIGIGAFAVPWLFGQSELLLLSVGEMDSVRYLTWSGLIIAGALFPWCLAMGFTFPFMMAFLREADERNTTSFSFLYLANVLGAVFGTLLSALVLIELVGFRATLAIAACLNFLVAGMSTFLALRSPAPLRALDVGSDSASPGGFVSAARAMPVRAILFFTGFASMAMEVVWVRAFTPILRTRTYSFASLLAVYLVATWLGSLMYRRQLARGSTLSDPALLGLLSIFALLPVVLPDPRLPIGVATALFSIFPLCAGLGYLTPKLIDEYSQGRPERAGAAYALNVLGSILGPLLAAYLLLPWVGARVSLILLATPFLLFFVVVGGRSVLRTRWGVPVGVGAFGLFLGASLVSVDYAEVYATARGSVVRRDHTATVVSMGAGMNKQLIVNGIFMTRLTPVTKFMAHLPLAMLPKPPESAVVICMGMGTTYRSLLSWDIDVTVVELSPSVKEAFGYYWNDAEAHLRDPRGRIVVDDGRRFLRRSQERFDVITIDPPPPIETAGSSLLYSEEFLELVAAHLTEDGVLHHWFPLGEQKMLQAVARSLSNVFPYIRVFRSVEDWGHHFIAAEKPIEIASVDEVIARMPARARRDLVEWSPKRFLRPMVAKVLASEVPLEDLLNEDESIVVSDDRPFNEYYVLRRIREGKLDQDSEGAAIQHPIRRLQQQGARLPHSPTAPH